MKSNRQQVIHNESMAELTRLKDEYAFIGRRSTIDKARMTLTVHNIERKKQKKRSSMYDRADS